MFQPRKTTLALALAATLLFSGCIGNGQDSTLGFLSEDDGGVSDSDNLIVEVAATNASSSIAHIGFALDSVFAHDAETPFPDGYHGLSLATERADVVTGSDTQSFTVASGELQAGTYDQVLFRLSSAQAHGAKAMEGMDHGDGHAHGDSSDGHAHGDDSGGHGHGDGATSDAKSGLSVTTDAFDLPVNVTFDVKSSEATTIELVLDVGASTTENTFQPTFETVTVKRGGETVSVVEDAGIESSFAGEGPATPPPAARMAVFAPNGDQVLKPSFDVEQGKFVNTLSSAYGLNETVRFTGTESEAVAGGASIDSYAWDFGDGATATGPTAQHAYQEPGVYEVELTVTDSKDVSASHMVRVVVAGWTQTIADTSFEDGPADWTSGSAYADPLGAGPAVMTWELAGEGYESATAWKTVRPASDQADDPGYTPGESVTLTSVNYTVPEDYKIAGFSFALKHDASTGTLTASYSVDGETTQITSLDAGDEDWTFVDAPRTLSDHAGKTVQFTFEFSSAIDEAQDGETHSGPGGYVDAFTLGGMPDSDMNNLGLLDQAGGGHDHGGHSH